MVTNAHRRILAGCRTAALLVGVVLASATSVCAATLSEYQSRVQSAHHIAERLYFDEQIVEVEPLIAQVRALLPARETVEFDQTVLEVDNEWLGPELDTYLQIRDYDERSLVIERVYSRLTVMNSHLQAVLNDPTSHATADERAKIEEILSRPEFRNPGDDPIAKFFRDLRKKISDFMIEIAKRLFGATEGSSFNAGLRATILGVGLIALVLLVRSVAQAVARRRSGEVRGKKTILGEEVDEFTTAADLATAARALANKGEYRSALRKLFVALIYQMDERDLVSLHADATNREYLALVRKFGGLHPVMASMTSTFERVWYGNEQVDRSVYDAFEKSHSEASAIVERLATKPS